MALTDALALGVFVFVCVALVGHGGGVCLWLVRGCSAYIWRCMFYAVADGMKWRLGCIYKFGIERQSVR